MATDRSEKFWEYTCNFDSFLYPFLVFGLIFLALILFSFQFVEPGTAAYVVLQIDLAVTVVTLVLVGATIVMCSRRT